MKRTYHTILASKVYTKVSLLKKTYHTMLDSNVYTKVSLVCYKHVQKNPKKELGIYNQSYT